MDFADPTIILTPCSTVLAFKSFNFFEAISSHCLIEIVLMISLPGSLDPFFIFKASLIKNEAGGSFYIHCKTLVSKISNYNR